MARFPAITLITVIASLIAAACTLLAPQEAQACGGLFCDGGTSTSMPVDQSAEQVLFVRDGENMEVHIRVLYEGEAENFAWVIPIQTSGAVTFEMGSDPLFEALSDATAPQFTLMNPNGEAGCSSSSTSGGFVSADAANSEGPAIESQGNVGSFEFTVLSGGTAASVMQWLAENGYEQVDAAEPILEAYLQEGHKLAALKLQADAATQEIHPIIVRFPGDEPCVPLRLTGIAAAADMGVVVYALDTERLFPVNYEHVHLNLLRLDQFDGANYKELTTLAVDEAGGRAFVTEYRGDSVVVGREGLYDSSWDSGAFVDIEPWKVGLQLEYWGVWDNPMLFPILRQYLPAPKGVPEEEFWAYLDSYAGLIDLDAWDGAAFAAEIEEKIVAPGLQADMLLDTWPLLTRMYTTISPQEMSEDPVFAYRTDLPDVSRNHNASRSSDCDEIGSWEIAGHELCETGYDEWPAVATASAQGLPWALRVERIPLVGAPQTVTDNAEAIALAVEVWNAEVCGGVVPGDSGEGGESNTSDESGSEDAGEGGDNPPGQDGTATGCGCTASESGRGGSFGGLLMMLFGISARRRRRAHR